MKGPSRFRGGKESAHEKKTNRGEKWGDKIVRGRHAIGAGEGVRGGVSGQIRGRGGARMGIDGQGIRGRA